MKWHLRGFYEPTKKFYRLGITCIQNSSNNNYSEKLKQSISEETELNYKSQAK